MGYASTAPDPDDDASYDPSPGGSAPSDHQWSLPVETPEDPTPSDGGSDPNQPTTPVEDGGQSGPPAAGTPGGGSPPDRGSGRETGAWAAYINRFTSAPGNSDEQLDVGGSVTSDVIGNYLARPDLTSDIAEQAAQWTQTAPVPGGVEDTINEARNQVERAATGDRSALLKVAAAGTAVAGAVAVAFGSAGRT